MATNNEWTIEYRKGQTCRTIEWNGKEVALVNPRGDFDEKTEADLAAGLCFAGKMHALLKKLDQGIGPQRIISDTLRNEIKALLHAIETVDTKTYQEPDE